MKMLIPISIRTPGGGQHFFPKALRGKLLNETEAKKVWKEVTAAAARADEMRKMRRRKSA